MIADVEETVSAVSANHRVRKMDIFDYGLQLSLVMPGDPKTEDGGDLVGIADGAVAIQQSVAQLIQRSAALKDQVVAIFDLGEKKPMLTTAISAFRSL